MVKILYFAGLREAVGTAREDITLEAGVADIAALRRQLAARGEPWAALTRGRSLRAALNQQMVGDAAALKDGDEVAFFPPVTGG